MISFATSLILLLVVMSKVERGGRFICWHWQKGACSTICCISANSRTRERLQKSLFVKFLFFSKKNLLHFGFKLRKKNLLSLSCKIIKNSLYKTVGNLRQKAFLLILKSKFLFHFLTTSLINLVSGCLKSSSDLFKIDFTHSNWISDEKSWLRKSVRRTITGSISTNLPSCLLFTKEKREKTSKEMESSLCLASFCFPKY